MRRERADEVAAARLEALGGRGVEPGRALELARQRGSSAAATSRRCVSGRSSRRKARKRSAHPGASSWSHSTGVSDSVTRPGRGVEHVEQRQVGGRHRLPQPLLAERPRPEALHVGHVGVQDDAEARRSRPQDREEVQRAVEVTRAQREVAHRDRGREAVVERLRDAAARRGSSPSRRRSIATWWARSLRAWKRPSSSTEPKCRSHSARNSAARYSLDVPRVAGVLLALRRQREHVRGRDVGDPVAPDQRRAAARARRRGPARARSSAGTRRSRRRPPTARACCARSAASAPSTSAARARRRRGWRPPRPPRPPCGRARTSRSPRRTRGRPPAGRRSATRSTRRRRGGGGTSSSPPGRRGACARRSAGGAARRAAGRAGGRARARRARTLAARAA